MSKTNFLDLPKELRNDIYFRVIRQGCVFVIYHYDPVPLREPAIAAVCRQVRTESLSIFYGNNTFTSTVASISLEFLERLGRESVGMLRNLRAFDAP